MNHAVLQSVHEFCRTYGFAKGTLYAMIRRRQIPVIRTGIKGHGIKIDPQKVIEALEQPVVAAGTATKGAA